MDLVFGLFNLIGTLFVDGVTVVLAVCAGAWIGAILGMLLSSNSASSDDSAPGIGGVIGAVIACCWAIYCLATAVTIVAAFLAVVGMIVVGLMILFFAFIICAT